MKKHNNGLKDRTGEQKVAAKERKTGPSQTDRITIGLDLGDKTSRAVAR